MRFLLRSAHVSQGLEEGALSLLSYGLCGFLPFLFLSASYELCHILFLFVVVFFKNDSACKTSRVIHHTNLREGGGSD